MTSTTHTDSGKSASVRRGIWPATVTDRGGLLVRSTVVPLAESQTRCPEAGLGSLELTPAQSAAVVAMAARAPSLHNTQPWQFRVRGNVIELLVDPDRWLRHIDPDGRELMISCGAALFGLRLGLRSLGLLPVTELLPDLEKPWLAARVRPAGHAAMNKVEAEMAAAVPHRHTHRGPFTPGEVAARLLTALVADAAAEGAELLLASAGLTGQLVRLAEVAAAEQSVTTDAAAETRSWVRPPGSLARDGVPAWAIASRAALTGSRDEALPRLPQRDFGPEQSGSERRGSDRRDGVPPSATAALSTAGDTPADWLRAGQALHRLLLRAATRWVFASLQSQPLESPRHRQEVRELLGLTGYPQLLLQFGRSNTAPATPRRPQVEVRAD